MMLIRHIKNVSNQLTCILYRRKSTTHSFFNTTVDEEKIATISFNRRPVNSINLECIQELNSTLQSVQKNECKAVILTSAQPKIFSAGMDLFEFHKAEAQRLVSFWSALQELFSIMYGSPYITTAAINGYAGAGACVVSLLCEYRAMVNNDKSLIGLNDTAVGIVAADWVRELMIRTMGLKYAETAIIASTMFTPEQALKVNLIDELATDQADAIEKCKRYIRKFDNIPVKARVEAKKLMREPLLKHFEENKKRDSEMFVKNILDPEIQQHIANYVELLKQKKK